MPLLPLSLPLLPQIVHFAQAAKHRHGTGGNNRDVGFAAAPGWCLGCQERGYEETSSRLQLGSCRQCSIVATVSSMPL